MSSSKNYEPNLELDQPNILLTKYFLKIFNINDELQKTTLSTNDPKYQEKVQDAIKLLEKMTEYINQLELFSKNEDLKELQVENLKFLIIPALLGDFQLKNLQINRLDALERSEIYYKDFIERLNDYGFCDINLKNIFGDNNDNDLEKTSNKSNFEIDSLIKKSQERNAKIQRYQELKQLENDLKNLKQILIESIENNQQSEDQDQDDDDNKRKFYLKLIKRWLNQALDDLASIEQEKPLVKMHSAMMKQQDKNPNQMRSQQSSQSKKPFKPIILTRNKLQKEIYGAGYPSIPTYSVDEFVEQKIQDGSWQMNKDNKVYSNSLYDWAENPEKKKQEEESDEIKKEKLLEKDDPQELKRLRNWDEWKDDHRRGEGNRHNMG